MPIQSTILLDSVNIFGNRSTTIIAELPRIVLAELNTHKMISKNSASSRAIPFEKMLQRVQDDPFIPIKWMKDHSGMQGNEYFTDNDMTGGGQAIPYWNECTWLEARNNAIKSAKELSDMGVTKQVCNRLLEPFLWHKALLSATEWSNFLALRAEGMAEIHLQALAYDILEKMNASIPTLLKEGEWHLPFYKKEDYVGIQEILNASSSWEVEEYILKIATARCARTSYNNFDGTSDYKKDVELHDRLAGSGHWSPFEHCMRAMNGEEFYNHSKTFTIPKSAVEEYESKNNSDWYEVVAYTKDGAVITEFGWSKNVRGFIQYRSLFMNENRNEPRLLKK